MDNNEIYEDEDWPEEGTPEFDAMMEKYRAMVDDYTTAHLLALSEGREEEFEMSASVGELDYLKSGEDTTTKTNGILLATSGVRGGRPIDGVESFLDESNVVESDVHQSDDEDDTYFDAVPYLDVEDQRRLDEFFFKNRIAVPCDRIVDEKKKVSFAGLQETNWSSDDEEFDDCVDEQLLFSDEFGAVTNVGDELPICVLSVYHDGELCEEPRVIVPDFEDVSGNEGSDEDDEADDDGDFERPCGGNHPMRLDGPMDSCSVDITEGDSFGVVESQDEKDVGVLSNVFATCRASHAVANLGVGFSFVNLGFDLNEARRKMCGMFFGEIELCEVVHDEKNLALNDFVPEACNDGGRICERSDGGHQVSILKICDEFLKDVCDRNDEFVCVGDRRPNDDYDEDLVWMDEGPGICSVEKRDWRFSIGDNQYISTGDDDNFVLSIGHERRCGRDAIGKGEEDIFSVDGEVAGVLTSLMTEIVPFQGLASRPNSLSSDDDDGGWLTGDSVREESVSNAYSLMQKRKWGWDERVVLPQVRCGPHYHMRVFMFNVLLNLWNGDLGTSVCHAWLHDDGSMPFKDEYVEPDRETKEGFPELSIKIMDPTVNRDVNVLGNNIMMTYSHDITGWHRNGTVLKCVIEGVGLTYLIFDREDKDVMIPRMRAVFIAESDDVRFDEDRGVFTTLVSDGKLAEEYLR